MQHHYSYRRDSIGFKRLARIAGRTPAMNAIVQTRNITIRIDGIVNTKSV